jgi:hypothetical protein
MGISPHAQEVEDQIATKVKTYMSALSHVDMPPPMIVMFGGVRMHGTIIIGNPLARVEPTPLRKSDLLLPAITFDAYGRLEDYRQALKPIFDALWNAAGYPGSQSYGPDGNWTRRT